MATVTLSPISIHFIFIQPFRVIARGLLTGQQPKYPVCFLTNGGGVLEATKAAQLSKWLGVQVAANQVLLAIATFIQIHLRLVGRASVPLDHPSEQFDVAAAVSPLIESFACILHWKVVAVEPPHFCTSGGALPHSFQATGS